MSLGRAKNEANNRTRITLDIENEIGRNNDRIGRSKVDLVEGLDSGNEGGRSKTK